MYAKNTQYVPRYSDTQLDTKPVLMSREMKVFIVDEIGKVGIRGPCLEANEILRVNIKTKILKQLEKPIPLVPTVEYVNKLVTIILLMYTRALCEDGKAVGYLGATSIVSAITQSTMKTFSLKSGSSVAVEGGILGLITLVWARLNRRHDAKMIIHFNTFVTFNDVIDMRALIVEMRVNQILIPDRYEIKRLSGNQGQIVGDTLERFWWHDAQMSNPVKRLFENMNGNTHVLRLYLNKEVMFAHKITPEKVASAIEKTKGRDGSIYVIYSPFSYGIIDVIISPESNFNMPEIESEQISLLKQTVYDKLHEVIIQGISGISSLSPKTYKLTQIIQSEEKRGDTYIVTVGNKNAFVFESIFTPLHRLEKLFKNNNIIIIKRVRDPISREIVSYHLECNQSPTKILEAAKENDYTYMITSGSNFDEIIKIPWVDPLRSTPNNIFEITAKIGCEACMRYFKFELSLVLETVKSKDVNSRHVSLMCDVIFVEGKPAGMTAGGGTVRNQGVITLASWEKGGTAFTKAAANFSKEKLTNTTPSILVGVRASVGNRSKLLAPTAATITELKQIKILAENRKRIIQRDSQGIGIVVKRNNQLLKDALSRRSINEELPAFLAVAMPNFNENVANDASLSLLSSIDLTGRGDATSTTSIVMPFPNIISEATAAIAKSLPSYLEGDLSEVPYLAITNIPSDIQQTVTSPKLHSLDYYKNVFAPMGSKVIVVKKIDGSFAPNYGIVPDIIMKYKNRVIENINRSKEAPLPSFMPGVNIFSRDNADGVTTATSEKLPNINFPKLLVPFETTGKVVSHKLAVFPTRYSEVSKGASNLDSYILPNIKQVISYLVMPKRM